MLIFLLTLFVFIVGLIHYLMLKYTINKNGVKIDGLFKNIDILHKNIIIKVEPKKYENSVISEDINLILAALNSGV